MKQRVLLKGVDGLDLLHRISSVDIKHLNLKHKSNGLILNPMGKIESFFTIERLSSTEAEITFEDQFLEHLDRFTFAERYELIPLPMNAEPEMDEHSRILALTPRPGFEFQSNGQTNPLEVNLRSAIADQKGCYPGQEVIEKIISIGSPARRLCLLESAEPIQNLNPQSPLTSESGEVVGIITSVSDHNALAIIKRTHLTIGNQFFSGANSFNLQKVSS